MVQCKQSSIELQKVTRRPRSRQIQEIPELPDVPRVSSIKLLGVTLAENLSMEEHITDVISTSSRALYALRILRSHGMNDADIQTVFESTALSKLLYASPSWWGFTNANQRERLEGIFEEQSRHVSTPMILRLSQNFARRLMMPYFVE